MGQITQSALTIYNALVEELSDIATQQTIDNLLLDLKDSEGQSDYFEVLSRLDRIMNARGIPHERVLDNAGYYIKLLSRYTFPSYDELIGRMQEIMIDKMDQYYTPEQYMEQIVNHLEGKSEETVRLRILKQFIKEGNSLKDVGIKGDMAVRKYVRNKTPDLRKTPNNQLDIDTIFKYLDDGVFEPLDLEKTTADQRKPKGTYGLLTICDDLAKGLFHSNGFTKKYLYYFAIVYGMKYYTEDTLETYDKDSDIEYTLFEGYYVNNITRFLREEYKADTNGRYEKNPSGQGINKKNYEELVLLYYLNSNLTASEKLKKSEEMIRALKDSHKPAAGQSDTRTYILNWPDYFTLEEEAFFARIADHYDCSDRKTENEQNRVEAQNTAFHVYRMIREELEKEEMTIRDCTYGMSLFIDAAGIRENMEQFLTAHPGITREKLNDFLILVTRFNEFISYPALDAESAEQVSRLTIMGLFYYLFVEQNQNLKQKDDFKTVCKEFETQVNRYLEKAYYPSFSIKNYFDILIVFAAYTAIN